MNAHAELKTLGLARPPRPIWPGTPPLTADDWNRLHAALHQIRTDPDGTPGPTLGTARDLLTRLTTTLDREILRRNLPDHTP
jgi:hypothetical protein